MLLIAGVGLRTKSSPPAFTDAKNVKLISIHLAGDLPVLNIVLKASWALGNQCVEDFLSVVLLQIHFYRVMLPALCLTPNLEQGRIQDFLIGSG